MTTEEKTTEEKKGEILNVFNDTKLDELFIEAATELGYTDYFTNLPDLDDMTDEEVDVCYKRVANICENIWKKLC